MATAAERDPSTARLCVLSIQRVLHRLREIGLTGLAVLGTVCIAAVIAAAVFQVSFVVFRTGSMEPAYPVGALAAVRHVPASSLQPGDVATVQRTPNSSPITHRVVTAAADPRSPGTAVLTMKGDANNSADPVEYRVKTAGEVLFSVPVVGTWVIELRSPWMLGGCTVLLTGLVVWAFWPAAPTSSREEADVETIRSA